MMTYEQALAYIHGISWKGSRLGLERTQELLNKLDDPQKQLKFIHIAGTNGKGSTAAMLSSVLREAGYCVGLYTSPFINMFNERIQINGKPISNEDLAEATETVRLSAEKMEDHPTEFELITAIAMLYFKQKHCDIVVLEVGMGGALDSTNVIDTPEVAVLTAMGLDHVRELGPTMREIAAAKAGIIKENGIVVSYGGNSEADAVFEEACLRYHAKLIRPCFYDITNCSSSLEGQSFSYGDKKDLFIPFLGKYQLNNAATVLTVIDVLRQNGWNINECAVSAGLRKAKWPARFELLQRDPIVIVDGGHNPHGIKATADSLKAFFPNKKIVFVVGVMADKAVEEILSIVMPIAKQFHAVRPNNPRAMAADVLADRICSMGANAKAHSSLESAVRDAMHAAGRDGVVCALGSLYMSGDVRRLFGKTE